MGEAFHHTLNLGKQVFNGRSMKSGTENRGYKVKKGKAAMQFLVVSGLGRGIIFTQIPLIDK